MGRWYPASIILTRVFTDADPYVPEFAVNRARAVVGAASGAIGSVASVSAMGTVAGLSGAGISSGLAAVGSVAGGGMVAGVVVTAAAPAVAAAAIGYGVYRAWRWFAE